jgi:hypothetical protein
MNGFRTKPGWEEMHIAPHERTNDGHAVATNLTCGGYTAPAFPHHVGPPFHRLTLCGGCVAENARLEFGPPTCAKCAVEWELKWG